MTARATSRVLRSFRADGRAQTANVWAENYQHEKAFEDGVIDKAHNDQIILRARSALIHRVYGGVAFQSCKSLSYSKASLREHDRQHQGRDQAVAADGALGRRRPAPVRRTGKSSSPCRQTARYHIVGAIGVGEAAQIEQLEEREDQEVARHEGVRRRNRRGAGV